MRRGAARGIKGELWKGSEDKHSRSRKMKKWAAHAEAGRPTKAIPTTTKLAEDAGPAWREGGGDFCQSDSQNE